MPTMDLSKEFEFQIEFEIDPGEPMVMYYPDGSGHPGSPGGAVITKVMFRGEDITAWIEQMGLLGELETDLNENY